MVDFKKLSEEIEKKRQCFGEAIPIRNEKLFMELHQQICPGAFRIEHDHHSFRDHVCPECSAKFQKGTNIPMKYPGGYEEDMTSYFYGFLPEKLLEEHGLLKQAQSLEAKVPMHQVKKTKTWCNCKN
ncbi:hypothetical protein [uncultured Methanomethylovorans sp.]|uniref:hypothetical protein n=1 Tax=uncultured Methanomethylovorans sp. TaxID=183759 RepID=UPI002AA7A478|nr:hypothetical protein [uncultured Methanomethylovorans sp.]